MKDKAIEASLVVYYQAHGFDVHSYEDIIRLFTRRARYVNKKSI